AVRYQRPELAHGREIDLIRQQARGEVDVRYVGRVRPRSAPGWGWRRQRPLGPGAVIGIPETRAGTLGAFVRRPGDGALMLLSNNHILAGEDRAKVGAAVYQPAPGDGGPN